MRKLIKKILKENELQWINDVKSNQDIAQEIADETKIKNDALHTPFPPFSLLSSSPVSLALSLPFLFFRSFTKYGKEQYGLNDEDDINDVWERYKKLVRDKVNNINESDDMEWIQDVQSNQDIAQEIADETYIKDHKIIPPLPILPFTSKHISFHPLSPIPIFSFTKYCKEQYGLYHLDNEDDVNDIWKRYKKLVRDKINSLYPYDNLNESEDLQWIKDVEPYVSFADASFNTKYNVIIQDEDVFTESIEDCDENIDIGSISYVRVKRKADLLWLEIYCHEARQDLSPWSDIDVNENNSIDFWEGRKECLKISFYDDNHEVLLEYWFAPDDLIKLQYI